MSRYPESRDLSSSSPDPASESNTPAREDGRTARTRRTRSAVAEALLDLLQEGDARPTSTRIAERAGVSERTVFQHFDDLETLFEVASNLLIQRISKKLRPINVDLPFDQRVEAFASQRCRLNEDLMAVRRAARIQEPNSPTLTRSADSMRSEARREVDRVFADRLDRYRGAERNDLLEAGNCAASWNAWEELRLHSGLSTRRARKVVVRTLRALFAESDDSLP